MKGSSFLEPDSIKIQRVEVKEATTLLVKEDVAEPEEVALEENHLEEAMQKHDRNGSGGGRYG